MKIEYMIIAVAVLVMLVLLYLGFVHLIKNKTVDEHQTSTIDVEMLINALGGVGNLIDIKSTTSKVTTVVVSHDTIDIDKIRQLGASGIVEGQQSLTMIFGKESPLIADDLKLYIEKMK